MKRAVFLLPLGVFFILIVFFAFGLRTDPTRLPSPLIGRPAPLFDLPSLIQPERRITTADLAGKMSLLNVWATWCTACMHEHPVLMKIAESGEVALYGLDYKDRREDALAWLAKFGDPYLGSAFDEDGRVGIDWGVYGTPETFLIDKTGTVRYKHIGPLSWEDWTQTLRPLVRQLKAEKA
jgi:cytochrome c biogenesis protein CcmG/thiol:disulfide interchange protein DsbE